MISGGIRGSHLLFVAGVILFFFLAATIKPPSYTCQRRRDRPRIRASTKPNLYGNVLRAAKLTAYTADVVTMSRTDRTITTHPDAPSIYDLSSEKNICFLRLMFFLFFKFTHSFKAVFYVIMYVCTYFNTITFKT